MNKPLIIVLALGGGLLGGLLTRYIGPPSAFAQNQASVTKEIRAQSFTLVDSSNRTIGTFTSDADRLLRLQRRVIPSLPVCSVAQPGGRI